MSITGKDDAADALPLGTAQPATPMSQLQIRIHTELCQDANARDITMSTNATGTTTDYWYENGFNGKHKRAIPFPPVPAALKTYAPSVITSACSCLVGKITVSATLTAPTSTVVSVRRPHQHDHPRCRARDTPCQDRYSWRVLQSSLRGQCRTWFRLLLLLVFQIEVGSAVFDRDTKRGLWENITS